MPIACRGAALKKGVREPEGCRYDGARLGTIGQVHGARNERLVSSTSQDKQGYAPPDPALSISLLTIFPE